jgi:hypothetical protein
MNALYQWFSSAATEFFYSFILKCQIVPLRISIAACTSHSSRMKVHLHAYTLSLLLFSVVKIGLQQFS